MAVSQALAQSGFTMPDTTNVVDDAVGVPANETVVIDPTANDVMVPDDARLSIAGNVPCGTASVENMKITYTAAGCSGTVQLRYVLNLAGDVIGPATITVSISAEEEKLPTPIDDDFVVAGQDVTRLDVYDNDQNLPNALPKIEIREEVNCGALSVDNIGIVYNANEACAGEVAFKYGFENLPTEALVSITIRVPETDCGGTSKDFEMVGIEGGRLNLAQLADHPNAIVQRFVKQIESIQSGDPQDIASFCIMVEELPDFVAPPMAEDAEQQTCTQWDRLSDGAVPASAMSFPTLQDISSEQSGESWTYAVPSLAELLWALVYLSENDKENYHRFRRSLVSGVSEWVADSCGENYRMIVGSACRRSFSFSCYGEDRVASSVVEVGGRLIARRN